MSCLTNPPSLWRQLLDPIYRGLHTTTSVAPRIGIAGAPVLAHTVSTVSSRPSVSKRASSRAISTSRVLRALAAFCAVIYGSIFSTPQSIAQNLPVPARIVTNVDENSLVTLNGNIPLLVQPRYDRGEAPASTALTGIRLVLSRSAEQEAALDRYLVEVQDSSSPNYHKWLSPEQFGQLYGPADSDIASITSWLESRGLKVESISTGRTSIAFSGTAGQVAEVLHARIHSFDAQGTQFYSNTTDPKIPSALAPVIRGIAHLNTIQPRPLSVPGHPGRINLQTGRLEPVSASGEGKARPDFTGGTGTSSDPYFLFMVPGDAATIYDTPNSVFNANYTSGTSYSGKGVTIGIAGDALLDAKIAQTYRQNFVGDTVAPAITNVDGVGSGDNTDAITEAYLDVEVAGGLAPEATIHFYTSKDLYGAIDRAVNDNKVDIFSVSFGICELSLSAADNLQLLNWWKQAAAQGIAVTVSAGDSGSAGCENFDTQTTAVNGLQVSAFASTPYNVAVGGTDFNVDALGASYSTYADTSTGSAATLFRTAKQYIPETTWNDSVLQNLALSANVPVTGNAANIVAGSGGPSTCAVNTNSTTVGKCIFGYSKPFWQTGAGVPKDGVRDLPDVSLMAGDGVSLAAWLICDSAQHKISNGSSITANCTTQSDGNIYFERSGGTSASAPAFAGILALVQEKTGSRLGQAAQQLYALSNGSHAGEIFHDITVGNNAVACTANTPNCVKNAAGYYFETGYDTTAGYDLATGLGTVDAKNLVAYWGTGTNPAAPPAATITVAPAVVATAVNNSLQVAVSVTRPSSGEPIPSGTVELTSDSYDSSAQTLANGTYSFTIPAGKLTIGEHTLVATYSGDATYGANFGAATVKITPQILTLTVKPSVTSISANASLPVTVSLSGWTTAPTGTVTLSGGGYDSGAQKISGASYTFTIPANTLTVGNNTLTAAYSGDANNAPQTGSATVSVTAAAAVTPSVVGPVVIQVVAGGQHTCALTARSGTENETIQCWGSNSSGQLGDGTTTDSALPVVVSSSYYTINGNYDLAVVSLAAGDNHTCALLPTYEGAVCWGANGSGQLGNGTTTDSPTPVAVTAGAGGAAALTAGSAHTCALINDGTVQCWGENSHGQLGNGSTAKSMTPVVVSGVSGAVAIAAGGNHTCALLSNGNLECWGENGNGQLGNSSTTDSSTPVQVGGLGGVATALAVGSSHSCALLTDGTGKCWGGNNHGQLGNSSTTGSSSPVAVSGLNGVTAIAAGGSHTCAVTAAGGAKCWGENGTGQLGDGSATDRTAPVQSGSLTSVTALSLGGSHTCAQNAYGALQCWGDNGTGQLGNGTKQAGGILTPLPVNGMGGTSISVALGEPHACGLTAGGTANLGSGGTVKTNGTAFCWGSNTSGQLGNGSTVNSSTPVTVSGLSNQVKAIFPGALSTCATLTDGSAECWGNNANGILGNGTNTASATPVKVVGLSGRVQTLVATPFHACALIADGTIQCWGNNYYGGLGDGTNTNSTTPVKVTGVSGATAISAANLHACALISDGTVTCWGGGNPTPAKVTGLSGATAITSGQNHDCALISDGTVQCWGTNTFGELGNGSTTDSSTPVKVTGISGVSAISAGSAHTCALLSGGTVQCWGYNQYGELGNGSITNSSTPVKVTGLSGVTAISAGGETTIALTAGGDLQGWGSTLSLQLGDSTANSSLDTSFDHYVVPVPVFSGQSIEFTPPETLDKNTTTSLAALATSTGGLSTFFDGWTSQTCDVGSVPGDPNSASVTTKAPLLCGVRAAQYGGYNLHGGSLAPAPSQERLILVGAAASTPQAVLNPGSLDFGSVQVGATSAAQTITFSNPGNATLNISGISVSGTNPGQFHQTNNCGATLAAGASCTITATFTPASAASYAALISVTDNAAGSPHTATLTGTGAGATAPQAALTPASANFGSVTVGSSSASQTFTLTNGGNASLAITSIAIGGTNAAIFKIGANTCGSSLAGGANCTIAVTFSPSAAGSASASLSVVDSVGTQSSSLSGTGTTGSAPQAALSPSNTSFGSVNVGSVSSAKTFTLMNAGNATLPITSVSIGGTNASSFSVATNTCGSTLAAGGSCSIGVTFSPSAVGNASASLNVLDSVGTQSANLSGTGAAASTPLAVLSPANGTFGGVKIGSTSTPIAFTLASGGTANLSITSISITGTNASLFHIESNTCGQTLAPSHGCEIAVTFQPTATGNALATLSVVDNAGTQTAALNGAGVAVTTSADFSLAATPSTQSVQHGSSVSYTIQLLSTVSGSPFTTPVTLAASGLPAGASVSFSPASVTPGTAQPATSTMTITVHALSAKSGDEPRGPFGAIPATISLGCALLLWPHRRRMRRLSLLILLAAGLACAAGLIACGGGTGFAVPGSTSNITVTGTSGSTTHSTTVTLKVN